jgi:PilZ domain
MRLQYKQRDGRMAERRDVAATATVRGIGSRNRFDVVLDDLSAGGFRCKTSWPLEVDQLVMIAIPGFDPLEARVVWRDNSLYGCAFSRTLHIGVLEHLALRFGKR